MAIGFSWNCVGLKSASRKAAGGLHGIAGYEHWSFWAWNRDSIAVIVIRMALAAYYQWKWHMITTVSNFHGGVKLDH